MKGDKYEYKGKFYTAQELADIAGVSNAVMSYRLSVCKTVGEALVKGRMGVKQYLYNGNYYTAAELARIKGVNKHDMDYLLRRYKGDTQKAMSARKYKREKSK